MTDRNVQFPNRFEIVPVPGTTNIFDVTPAPGAVYEDGTFWNKQNVLKDATAALYGKSGNAVPDEIFAAIRPLITAAQNAANGRALIAVGSYIGDGVSSGSEKTIPCPFTPKAVFVAQGGTFQFDKNNGGLAVAGSPVGNSASAHYAIEIITNGFKVGTAGIYAATNTNGIKYNYIAIG